MIYKNISALRSFKYYNQEIGKDAQDWILRMLDESSGTSSEIRESMSI